MSLAKTVRVSFLSAACFESGVRLPFEMEPQPGCGRLAVIETFGLMRTQNTPFQREWLLGHCHWFGHFVVDDDADFGASVEVG